VIVGGHELEHGSVVEADAAVVGAGPAGIVTAFELANGGLDVALIESGLKKHSPEIQRLSAAEKLDPEVQIPLTEATRRQLGGGSAIWGGRCVPYDPIDFEPRSDLHDVRWPVAYEEVARYFQRACDWFACGQAAFDAADVSGLEGKTLVPGLPDGDVRTSALERWSLPTDFGRRYGTALRRSRRVRALTGLTCVEIVRGPDRRRVDRLELRGLDGREARVRARWYVLACGGLGTARLLLASDRSEPGGIGNHSGHLGRWYMGHVSGRIAGIRFTTPPSETIYAHERDPDGVYVRRRLSFCRDFLAANRLSNVIFWLGNPPLGDPAHGSGVLSFAYLALASPLGSRVVSEAIRQALTREGRGRSVRRHLRNVVRDLPATAAFAASFGYRRLAPGRRAPGFFVESKENAYSLRYHGEQLPNASSRVMLGEEVDGVGMRRLTIDLRYSAADVDCVLRAHRSLDDYLRRYSRGLVEYEEGDLEGLVRSQLGDGCHQIGTTRMSERPEDGVVDRNLAVHGFDDLFVASSSTFPTSSQANPAFTTVAFALRLADHLLAQGR
jgi:choline dehydrogenase-like flavoprotein